MNKHLYFCHPLVLSSPTLMMHGHMNLTCNWNFLREEAGEIYKKKVAWKKEVKLRNLYISFAVFMTPFLVTSDTLRRPLYQVKVTKYKKF